MIVGVFELVNNLLGGKKKKKNSKNLRLKNENLFEKSQSLVEREVVRFIVLIMLWILRICNT